MSLAGRAYACLAAIGLIATSATVAYGQQSPFAEVSDLCTKRYDDFPAVIDAFHGRGWEDQDKTAGNYDIVDMMMFAMFYGTDPQWSVTKEEFTELFNERQNLLLDQLGLGMQHRAAFFHPEDEATSSLIVSFETRGAGTQILTCNIAGSTTAESDWLDSLAENGKLPDAFINFDQSANMVAASPIGKRLTDTSKESHNSSLMKLSHERVSPILPRPMPYDLFLSIATAHFGDG